MAVTAHSPNRKPRWRAARRQALNAQGITTTDRQRVWNVRPTALLTIPKEFLERALPGLVALPGSVWLLPNDARTLLRLDRAAGGYSVITKTEFKCCTLCRRPILANEAEERRQVMESSPTARTLPCGSNCAQDRELKLWTRDRGTA